MGCQQFLFPWYESHVKKATFESRVSVFRKQFKEFNKYFINNIAPVDIQKWQIMMKNQVSNSYTRLVQCLLSLVFDRAIVLGFCEENPIKFVGNWMTENKKIDFWTKTEFEKVISLIDLNNYVLAFQFHHNLACVYDWCPFRWINRSSEWRHWFLSRYNACQQNTVLFKCI